MCLKIKSQVSLVYRNLVRETKAQSTSMIWWQSYKWQSKVMWLFDIWGASLLILQTNHRSIIPKWMQAPWYYLRSVWQYLNQKSRKKHLEKMLCTQLWMWTGVKDGARYMPIHRVVENLGADLCSLLPGLHALTGYYDYIRYHQCILWSWKKESF